MTRAAKLDPLSGVAGLVELGGIEYEVLDLTAREIAALEGAPPFSAQLQILERIAPSLPRDALTPRQISAVFAVALGAIEHVEDLFPNAARPSPAPPPDPA